MTENDRVTEAVDDGLDTLDSWRASGFEGNRRAALALARRLEERMEFFSPDRLVSLAESRGCHRALPEAEELEAALRDDYPAGETLCRDVAQRIVDTAIFGRDLPTVELHQLVELAYAHRIEHGRMIGDWRRYAEVIGASRLRWRHAEVFVGSLGFDDLDRFPDLTPSG